MNKPLVLVVEDDTPVRNLITTTLKTHEYRYLSTQNGTSAVMETLSHNPDIVLLDLGLPDMDGVENHYIVQKTDILQPTDVDAVEHSGYDLVLYTCTYGGKTRITVFCDRITEPAA